MKKGIVAEIFRSTISGNNLYAQKKQVTIIGENIPEYDAPTENAPAVVVDSITFMNKTTTFVRPADPKHKNTSFGGDFVFSHDSRFANLFSGPVKLYDHVDSNP